MILQVWGSAAAIVAGSLLLGRALSVLRVGSRAAGPAVGLSLLIVISSIAIKLPGAGVTAAIILLLLLVAAAALVIMRPRSPRFAEAPVAVVCVAAFGAAIPFISAGRVGLLGVAINDMAAHLEYAEALRSAVTRAVYGLPAGYPLGPHSLAATVATGLGARLDLAFTGLLIAIVVVTALTGANALIGEAGWKRVVIGTLAGLLYLSAAYYGYAAFKETLMGLFVLALALHLQDIRRGPALRSWPLLQALVPASVICASAIYVYGYLALVWLGLTVAIWIAMELISAPGRLRRWRADATALVLGVVAAIGVSVLLLAPSAGRILNLFNTFGVSPAGTGAITTSNRGDLITALPAFEALGIWQSIDYRYAPSAGTETVLLEGLALAVLLFGLAWSLVRREFVLPAAVAACALIWWRSSQTQSIYVTAKALAIAAPVVAVTGLRALLSSPRPPRRVVSLAKLVVTALFVFFAARSSYEVLANDPVWPPESTNELLSLDHITRGQTVLFLGATDFTEWLFHDSRMSALAPTSGSLGQASPRPSKPNIFGTALDFDSTDAASLNRFRYVITTNTADASQPPQAFRLIRVLPLYELWQRTGTVAPRQVIEPAGAPGAVLNCATAAGRALSRRRGVAAVMAPPVVGPPTQVLPGGLVSVPVALPPGRWQLSLQYTSGVSLTVAVGSSHWRMPAYEDRAGPVFQVGDVVSRRGTPVVTTFGAAHPSPLTGVDQVARIGGFVFTRLPDTRTLVPLSRSCGRYVDWYRIAPSTGR